MSALIFRKLSPPIIRTGIENIVPDGAGRKRNQMPPCGGKCACVRPPLVAIIISIVICRINHPRREDKDKINCRSGATEETEI